MGIGMSNIINYEIVKGSANGEIFIDFIKALILKLDKNKKYYLLLDHTSYCASIHRTKRFKKIN